MSATKAAFAAGSLLIFYGKYTILLMLFQTTDDRIRKLEKRADEMEKRMNRTLAGINDAFTTVTDVVAKLQKENEGLRKEKAELEKSRKQVAGQMTETGIKRDIKEIAKPAKNIVAGNFEFIQDVAREGLTSAHGASAQPAAQAGADGLARLVEKEGEIQLREAAARLKVHELQAEHWASAVKDRVGIAEKKNRKYLFKIKG